MPTFEKLAATHAQRNMNAAFASLRLSWHPILSRFGTRSKMICITVYGIAGPNACSGCLIVSFQACCPLEQRLPGKLIDLNLPMG
ncbi:MAG TPA: hypothetical protein DCR61_14855 [Verrucomicrobiales bacterium]|nr:hypothetical protein [Pedosphaera sp.]HAR00622.1 hypothetical protein [Verrucomicrobiales bacterium]HCP36576.1 hypothetical protein [Verrucomicrobiales bacterium]